MDKQEATKTVGLIKSLALGKAKDLAHSLSRSGAEKPAKVSSAVDEIVRFTVTSLALGAGIDPEDMMHSEFFFLREIVLHALLVARYPASEGDYLDWQHATEKAGEEEGLIQ